jgi:hypothetical protein
VPAVASCPTVAGFDRLAPADEPLGNGSGRAEVEVWGLADHLAVVPDPRQPQGIRHTLRSILLITAAAVCTGARSFAAIGEWASDAPQRVLARLGVRYHRKQRRYVPPDEATLRRTLQHVDAEAIDAAICAWLQERLIHRPQPKTTTPTQRSIAVDGKTLRGSRHDGTAVHLLAACWPRHKSPARTAK